MKKVLLSIIALAGVTFASNAQDFKPKAGSVTTEFGLTGGINNTSFDSKEADGLLRFRYFAKQDLAYRIGFAAGVNQNTAVVFGPNDEEGTIKTSTNSLFINLGAEKHFAGTDRLSPYVGADIVFGTTKDVEKGDDVTSGGTYTSGHSYEQKGPGDLSIGLRGVVGADYYIAKSLFLGAEAGLGFGYTKDGKTKFEETGVPSVEIKSPGSSFNLATNFVAAVRIGFVF